MAQLNPLFTTNGSFSTIDDIAAHVCQIARTTIVEHRHIRVASSSAYTTCNRFAVPNVPFEQFLQFGMVLCCGQILLSSKRTCSGQHQEEADKSGKQFGHILSIWQLSERGEHQITAQSAASTR